MSSKKSLADYVRQARLDKGLSCMDVQKQSARGGKKIAASYVNRIENGSANRISGDRLLALARGLGVPVDELWAAASGQAPPSDSEKADEQRLVMLFRELPAEKREDLLKMIEALHSGQGSRKRRTA